MSIVFSGDLNVLYNRHIERQHTEECHWSLINDKETKDFLVSRNSKLDEFELGTTVKIDISRGR